MMLRVLAVAGVLALLAGPDALAARHRHAHAGHAPRVSTATYTVPASKARPHTLRMASGRPTRLALNPRHSLMRGS